MPIAPTPANGYLIEAATRLDPPTLNSILSSIHARLNAREAADVNEQATLDQLVSTALAYISTTIGPQIVATNAQLTLLQQLASAAEDRIAQINSGGIAAASVTVSNINGLSATTTQAAFAELQADITTLTTGLAAAVAAIAALPAAIPPASYTSVTANIALVAGQQYRLRATTGSVVLTLPASPASGTTIRIVDGETVGNGATYTLARNGQTIMTFAEDMVIDTPGINFEIWFNGTTWRLR
ncbi:MAG: hypothetical protein ACRDBL_09015 [Rhabdaerophilum sp.]